MNLKNTLITLKSAILIGLVCVFLSGCASTKASLPDQSNNLPLESVSKEDMNKEEISVPVVVPVEPKTQTAESQAKRPEVKKGVIFGKTDFLGLLKTKFVKLFFENQDNPNLKFQLHIGVEHKSDQVKFPWDVKTVQSGYFFIELPEGKYKITSISIPVGSSIATENIDIDLTVMPEQVTYVGTLQAVGTKEKIKLGGVPVIKPGFEYSASVFEELQDAQTVFKQTHPEISTEISVNLMKLNKN